MLLRRLTHVVLLSALAAGCSQSLFDDGSGGDDPGPGPRPDAREGTPPDADPSDPDAGMMTPEDGSVPPNDGRLPPDALDDCPGACIQDNAFENFDDLQGGTNGRWRYVEVLPDGYGDMTSSTFPQDILGFTGTGTPAPSLAYCPTSIINTACTELPGTLALTTTAPDAHHPALMWIAPYSGTYTVEVSYATAPGTPDIPATVMITQNGQSNVLQSKALDDPSRVLYVEPPLRAGDLIVLSVITESEMSVSAGVNVIINGPY